MEENCKEKNFCREMKKAIGELKIRGLGNETNWKIQ